jgi:hypothetical protein
MHPQQLNYPFCIITNMTLDWKGMTQNTNNIDTKTSSEFKNASHKQLHDYLLIDDIVSYVGKSLNPVYATISDKWTPCH